MTIYYSDVAADEGKFGVEVQDGGLCEERATYTGDDGLAGGDFLYMHRIRENDRISQGSVLFPDAEDAATNFSAEFGVFYDSAGLTDDPNGFVTDTELQSAAWVHFPTDSTSGALAEDFIAEGDGYVGYKFADDGSGGATKAATFISKITKTVGAPR